jgi:hypothetical protein
MKAKYRPGGIVSQPVVHTCRALTGETDDILKKWQNRAMPLNMPVLHRRCLPCLGVLVHQKWQMMLFPDVELPIKDRPALAAGLVLCFRRFREYCAHSISNLQTLVGAMLCNIRASQTFSRCDLWTLANSCWWLNYLLARSNNLINDGDR